MITGVSIENFKLFKKFEIQGLSRLNLISGKNNVGKSTLLEALFLFMDHASSDSFGKMNMFRGAAGNGVSSIWDPLFYHMDTNKDIIIKVFEENRKGELRYSRDNDYLPNEITGIPDEVTAQFRSANKESYSLKVNYSEQDYKEESHFSINANSILRVIETSLNGNEIRKLIDTQFVSNSFIRDNSILINGIGNMELNDQKSRVIKALQVIDPNIEDVLTLSIKGYTQLYVRVGGELLPIHYSGDGVLKLLSICLAIMERKGGLVLIDEIETGFHYSMYEKLWNTIDIISKESDCQVMATTHSYELIESVNNGISNMSDFSYYRVGRKDDEVLSFRYDKDMLNSAIKAEMEVR